MARTSEPLLRQAFLSFDSTHYVPIKRLMSFFRVKTKEQSLCPSKTAGENGTLTRYRGTVPREIAAYASESGSTGSNHRLPFL